MADSENKNNKSQLDVAKANALNLFKHHANIRSMDFTNSPQPSNRKPPTTLANELPPIKPTQLPSLSKQQSAPMPPKNVRNLVDALIEVLGEEFEAVLFQKLLTRRLNDRAQFPRPASDEKREVPKIFERKTHRAKAKGHLNADITHIVNEKK